jgi:Zn-dependent M16 (insulinase) family peptidase
MNTLNENNDFNPVDNSQIFNTERLLINYQSDKNKLLENPNRDSTKDIVSPEKNDSELMNVDYDKNEEKKTGSFSIDYKKLIIKTASDVSNCVESFLVPNFSHEDFPKLFMAANLISLNHLHKEIREKGGAYGSGARFTSGTCTFFSFRDPNPHKTYGHFEQGIIKISKGRFSDNDIKEAKLYIFSDIDQVTTPQNKGLEMFFKDVTPKERDEFRKRLLNVTRDDIKEVTNKYFIEQIERGLSSRVLFGNVSENGINMVDDHFIEDGWDFINPMKFLSEEYFEEREI